MLAHINMPKNATKREAAGERRRESTLVWRRAAELPRDQRRPTPIKADADQERWAVPSFAH